MHRLLQSGILQGKLSVSQKGDPSEVEADRVADAVVSGSKMPLASTTGTGASFQRKEADGASASPSPSVPAGVVPSGGQTLDEGVRTLAEGRMGRDFSNVRIHTGTDANAAAKSIHARAYTVGEDIVFAQNQYQPNTQTGQRLIAHELAHVAQQRDRPQPNTLHRQDDHEHDSPIQHAEVSDLGEGFQQTVGSLIEVAAGAVGTEVELNVTVRVPAYRALFLSGSILLQVAHGAEGFKVKARPALGFSLGRISQRASGFIDLFGNYTVEAQATSGSRVLELVSLALEAEIRAMRDEPPPALLSVWLRSVGAMGTAILALDQADRAINLLQGEGYTSSFWPWIADGIWGEGHMAHVMATMQEGEFAETIDESSVRGVASQQAAGRSGAWQTDNLGGSISGRAGIGQRRRIERRPGQDTATEREDVVVYLKGSVGIGPLGGEIELVWPMTEGGRGGKFKAAVSAMFESGGIGEWNVAVDNLVRVIRLAVRVIQQHLRRRHGQPADLHLVTAPIQAGPRVLRGLFFEAGQNAVWNLASSAHGFELAAELDFDTDTWKFTLTVVDEIRPPGLEGTGQSVALIRKRTVVEIATGAPPA